MIILKRQMQAEVATKDTGYNSCQASINSDGCITLRNYDCYDKNQDEIIILSKEETKAIFSLFNRLSEMGEDWLPF